MWKPLVLKLKEQSANSLLIILSVNLLILLSGSSTPKRSPIYLQEREKFVKSEWVYCDEDGKLNYKLTERGDKILDFSHAGYMGGGVAIPYVPVEVVVAPTGEDDTDNIQAAIDKVSELPLNNSFRGAVLLLPGEYSISGSLMISADGVVLRGSGSGIHGNLRSTINLTGAPFNAITIRSERFREWRRSPEVSSDPNTVIVDSYVPAGSSSFSVEDGSIFKRGDYISIDKPITGEWISFMQMDDLVRDGKPQAWLREGSVLSTVRMVSDVNENRVTITVPLSDSYDLKYHSSGVHVRKITSIKRVSHVGVENLHIASAPQAISHEQRHFSAIRLTGEDCWIRNLLVEETMNSISVGGARMTLQNITVLRKARHVGSSRPSEISPNGGQVLVDRCNVIADNVWSVATGAGISGPIVILNCNFIGDQRAESHQRWTTGLLYDNVRSESGGIDLRNRGSMGSGHGWTMGWGVAWNCTAKDFTIQNPPGSYNWMIGCVGTDRPMPRPFNKEPLLKGGEKDAHGYHVYPQSLYLAQLKERLGEEALRNIGY